MSRAGANPVYDPPIRECYVQCEEGQASIGLPFIISSTAEVVGVLCRTSKTG
jgi:hypothetical protein